MEIKNKPVRIKSYFDCQYSDDENDYIGEVPKDIDYSLFPDEGYIVNFPKFRLKLKDGIRAPDYLSADIGRKLCSEKLKCILEKMKGPKDKIQWLKTSAIDLTGTEIIYYFMHFPQKYDVLNKSETKYSPSGYPIVPALSQPLLEGHFIFSYCGSGGLCLIVHENVKAEIIRQKCSGITMSREKVF